MQLSDHPGVHLTYCTNIHPGESWDEVFTQLQRHAPALKKRLCPNVPFGIGLRLSAKAAKQLLEDGLLERFKTWLDEEGLYVFTMNGFPYGSFHGQRVKDRVYAPDWQTPERVRYTQDLITILTSLLPKGLDGGISTVPLSYKPWLKDRAAKEKALRLSSINMARIAWQMSQINQKKGQELHLDIEPEPDCLLENTAETIDFFTNWLLPKGGSFLTEEYEIPQKEAEQILRDHIQLCYDTCHFAVEYEEPKPAISQIKEAGIRIGKVQISAAIKVSLTDSEAERRAIAEQLASFEESTYLHQVLERQTDGSIHHYSDLDVALPHVQKKEADEWRIHYHVPLFVDRFKRLQSTRDDIEKSLEVILDEELCRHIEIETYTWEVLPEALKTNLTDSIEREFRWVLGLL